MPDKLAESSLIEFVDFFILTQLYPTENVFEDMLWWKAEIPVQLLYPTWWPRNKWCSIYFRMALRITVIVSMTIILRHDPAAKPLMEIPISHRFHPWHLSCGITKRYFSFFMCVYLCWINFTPSKGLVHHVQLLNVVLHRMRKDVQQLTVTGPLPCTNPPLLRLNAILISELFWHDMTLWLDEYHMEWSEERKDLYKSKKWRTSKLCLSRCLHLISFPLLTFSSSK